MLKTRLVPVLLLKHGRMVKGKRFSDYRDVGDPVSAARIYNSQCADELIFLDIQASLENRGTLTQIISRVSEECFMPLTVGGGIRSVDDIRAVLNSGADKVAINTAAVEAPELIQEAAGIFGSQCLVISIDVKREDGDYAIYTNSGRTRAAVGLFEHIRRMEALGAGEILINSIDRDGLMEGYDLELIEAVQKSTTLPVIACGGAGNYMHLVDAITKTGVSAVACASLFHFGDNTPVKVRIYLKNKGITVKTA